jgi:putative FmdB family regulatory protein
MPTYEFRCPNGHEFEHFYRKMSEAQPTFPCPVCGLEAQRLVSAGAGLVFKGSGFYITDYGKDGKKNDRAPSKPAGKGEKSSGDSTSSTPAGAAPSPGGEPGGGTTGGGASDKAPAAPSTGAAPAPAPKAKPSRDE